MPSESSYGPFGGAPEKAQRGKPARRHHRTAIFAAPLAPLMKGSGKHASSRQLLTGVMPWQGLLQ